LADLKLTGNRTITAPAAAGNQLDLGNIDNGGNTLTVTGGLGTVFVKGGISGAGGLTMSATGDLVLQNNNTFGGYTGPTLISSGTISLTMTASLSQSSAVTVNGTLDLGGLNDTFASLSGSGNVTLGSGTLTVHVVPFPGTTFSGVISGTGGLNVIGTGANSGYFYLNGNNTYTGTTTVSGATLGGTGSIAGPVTIDGTSAQSVLVPGLPTSPFVGILNTGPVTFLGGG